MKKDVEYYLNLPYDINVKILDDGDYFVQYNDIGLNKVVMMYGDGKTVDEAINDLRDAFRCYLEDAIAKGEYIPEPNNNLKSIPLSITMKEDLVSEIDYHAKQLGVNRSAFLAISAKQYIKSL